MVSNGKAGDSHSPDTGAPLNLGALAADFWKMTVDPEVLTRTTPTLGEILSRDGIRSVYQPIVDIASNSVTSYEALSRGPAGTSLESPLALFGQARKEGRLTDLDWACRAAALRGGLDSLSPPLSLFLNIEPAASARVPDQFKGLWRLAGKSSKVIAEITERALTDDPAALLRTVAGLRELGWGIALDDVGADPRSLAMLPFLHPDVIKLDLRLIQDRPSANIAQVVHAVLAEVERSGTAVLAEGIETHEHLLTALAMGATLGQGWLFGRPGPLPDTASPPGSGLSISTGAEPPPGGATPFDIMSLRRPVRRGTKGILLMMSNYLERQAGAIGEAPVVMSTFQEAGRFSTRLKKRYSRLAGSSPLIVAFGRGIEPTPAPDVRGTDLSPGDPLADEWVVAVIGAHFAASFAARDLGDEWCPDLERRFDYCLSYDRSVVERVTSSLLAKTLAVPGNPQAS